MNGLVTDLRPPPWPMRPLRYLAEINSEALPETHPADADIEYVDIGAVGQGTWSSPPESLTFGAAPSRARRVVRDRDILVSTVRTYLRAVVRVEDPPLNLVASTGFAVLRPCADVVDSRFLYYWCLSDHFIESVVAKSTGVSYPAINATDLLELPVATPPLETQRRIADMLDAETARIDTLIAKNERVLALLAVREARVLEDEIYGDGSRPVGIHYLATYVNGYPFKPEDRSDEGTPIIRIAQLLGDLRQQDYYAGTPDPYCHIDSGDLIFSWSATLAARIWDGGPAFLNQHLFKVEPRADVDRDWLLHALNAAVPRMKSMTHGSTMTHITRPMMTQVRVPKPTLDEQRRIAASIRDQFDRLAALRTKVDRQQELLRTRRQALITAAVTGEIDTRGN